MSFDWINYLRLAEDLAARGDEASLRSAISRAYYFLFNVAYARAEKNLGPKPENDQTTHKWCWNAYANCGNQAGEELAAECERLKWLRVQMDYYNNQRRRLDQDCARFITEVKDLSAKLSAMDEALP